MTGSELDLNENPEPHEANPMKQKQFLNVVDDTKAHELLDLAFGHLAPISESCPLAQSWGRILADDVRAQVDVPGFDRSNMDGFAIRAMDSYGAEEREPKQLIVQEEDAISAGQIDEESPQVLRPHCAIPIATGGVLPRGADAVLMVEDSAPGGEKSTIDVFRALTPGNNVTGAGSDMGRGEIVLYAGTKLGSRETALLAAVGVAEVEVWRLPQVAVLSTGDEVKAPGTSLKVGEIYDSNSRIICDAVRELGGEPIFLGICPDDVRLLEEKLRPLFAADSPVDLVILSGGTSKGKGDLNHAVVTKLGEELPDSQGVIVHGVALKPGKPICVAEIASKPLAILPGFPTSAIFTFHEFVAPILFRLTGGLGDEQRQVQARLPMTMRSVAGRTEFLLVDLVGGQNGLSAYPLGAGSGSVSTFSRADGFIRIPKHQERVDEGEDLSVRLIGGSRKPADLVAIGSHCVGMDYLLGRLARMGFRVKNVLVGSMAGLRARGRGEGDVCGSHLLNGATGLYNTDFIPEGAEILGGYGRRQGIVFRPGDARFEGKTLAEITEEILSNPDLRMVNRNVGSGTRVLIDRLLQGHEPQGFHSESKSHHGVAAGVRQGRGDWGITLDILARDQDLGFVFVQTERFDLIVDGKSKKTPALLALQKLLTDETCQADLRALGLQVG